MRPLIILAAAVGLGAAPVAADEISDAIESALEAYQDGDVQYSIEELNFALQLLKEMKAQNLSAFLPEAPEGWTREIDPQAAASLGVMGGGTGAQAEYTDGVTSFTITIMADNPMVAAMSGLLGNPAMVSASGGKLVRVGREKFVAQDDQLSGLIGNRVLVQAKGGEQTMVVALLETMDLRGLAAFGS